MRTSNKCSPQGDAGTIDTGGAGMGGVAGILGTDAAATIFLLKSVYAFLAPLSFALARPPSPPKRRECTRHSRDRGRASPSSPHFDLPAFWPTKADGGRARTMADGCDVGRREGKRPPRADTLPRTGSFCDIFQRRVSPTQKQTIHSNHFTTVYDQKWRNSGQIVRHPNVNTSASASVLATPFLFGHSC